MADKIALTDEQDYINAQAIPVARKRPPQALRVLMQALEKYRQAKKMGWSRPWNKDNVVNFQRFSLTVGDQALCQMALAVIKAEAKDMPPEARRFVAELLAGGQAAMGFVFFQEFTDQDRRYEGAVVSYGRVSAANKRFRDRLDLILESEVVDGISQGLSRIRHGFSRILLDCPGYGQPMPSHSNLGEK
jgi:hypothetical protein